MHMPVAKRDSVPRQDGKIRYFLPHLCVQPLPAKPVVAQQFSLAAAVGADLFCHRLFNVASIARDAAFCFCDCFKNQPVGFSAAAAAAHDAHRLVVLIAPSGIADVHQHAGLCPGAAFVGDMDGVGEKVGGHAGRPVVLRTLKSIAHTHGFESQSPPVICCSIIDVPP